MVCTLVMFSVSSLRTTTNSATTAGDGTASSSCIQYQYFWNISPARRHGEQDDYYQEEVPGRPRGHGNGGSEGVAGREGGGGVVGQSHSNSEEEQTATNGTTDTNGSGPTLNFVSCELIFCFVSLVFTYFLFLFLIFKCFS